MDGWIEWIGWSQSVVYLTVYMSGLSTCLGVVVFSISVVCLSLITIAGLGTAVEQ